MEILTAIGSKIGEYLVGATIHQARYLFCFNSIVKDLVAEENKLKLVQDLINDDVGREEKNTNEIGKDVAKWMRDVEDVTADVQKLRAKVGANKSCLNGWCPNWGCRYWLGRKATKKTIIMMNLRNNGKFEKLARLKSLPGIEFFGPSDFMPFEATELACDQIIEALKNENVKMVGLYGTGGVGKTTLANVTGIKLQQQKIFDKVVVAVVSQHPDFKKVQNQLAEQLSLKLEEENIKERAKRLHLRFTDTKSKILVILDDVWKEHDLKRELGIPVDDNHNGCKILLTTRKQQVCSQMRCDSQIPLGILKPEEGLALLKNYAGIDDDDSTLIDVSKEVAGECKGLPLAIQVVGSALREKDVDGWNEVLWKLKNAKLIDVEDTNRDVYACLKSSYDYLNDEKAKLCFMFCTLFPEDHEIDLEDLVRYGVGLGWYKDVAIEKARSLLRGTIKGLKASSLLLDTGNEGSVKMHDIVRDVAIWIGSNEKTFMSKAGISLTEWPEDEALEQYKAISLIGNEIKELPNGVVCPNIHILLLGDEKSKYGEGSNLVIPDQFFEGMKTLKIITIIGGSLSLKSLQYLTNLQVLLLISCDVRDVNFVGGLKQLQILHLKDSSGGEILKESGYEISKLKQLDVDGLSSCISPTMLISFSRLEEFFGWIKNWEVEDMSPGRSNRNVEYLPKDFTFPKMQRYGIRYAYHFPDAIMTAANTLLIEDIKAATLVIFSALYPNLQCLYLKKVKGCQNIVPSIDEKGLTELTSLELNDVEDLECILDLSQQHIKSRNLVMLLSLSRLVLKYLPKLQWIWKAPAQHVCLKNLTQLIIGDCHNLTHLFSPSQAQSLVQLKYLEVDRCERMRYIIEEKFDGNTGEEYILDEDEITVVLPVLRKLTLRYLPNLISFCSENYYSTWQALQELELHCCPLLIINHEIEASLQYLRKELQILTVNECDNLCEAIPTLLKLGLTKLRTSRLDTPSARGVQVVFQPDIMGEDV